MTGRVIGLSPTVWFSDVTIDVGSGDGVELHDPVVNGDGLVGQVTAVTGGTAKVMLISDHSSAVAVKVVPGGLAGDRAADGRRTEPPGPRIPQLRQERPQGRGGGDRGLEGGEGIESNFPPNIPVGEVTKATIFEQEAQERANVRPYAELRNLSTLQVLTGGSRK